MHIDRRALLLGTAAVACGIAVGTAAQRLGWWDPSLIGSADPDAAITRVARSGEAALIKAYDAALSDPVLAVPRYLSRLQEYRSHHLDHLAALGGDDRDVQDAPRPGQPDPDVPGGAPPVPELPSDPAALPAYLAAAEQHRASLVSTGVRISTDGELARLQSLVVASETTHTAGWSRG
jgi:hypothetical protein